MKNTLFSATIKWLDTGEIVENIMFKIGDIEEDDDDIFYYVDSEKDLVSLKTEGVEDFIILDALPSYETRYEVRHRKNNFPNICTINKDGIVEIIRSKEEANKVIDDFCSHKNPYWEEQRQHMEIYCINYKETKL